MKKQYDISDEEFEVPTEDSDENAKVIPWHINHDSKNSLMINKGKVKEEDLTYFGIETLPIQNDNEIELVDYKELIMSHQPNILKDYKRLSLAKGNNWFQNKPKRITGASRLSWMNSTKISSKKLLELLQSKSKLTINF